MLMMQLSWMGSGHIIYFLALATELPEYYYVGKRKQDKYQLYFPQNKNIHDDDD
jgi:hypothetical protein